MKSKMFANATCSIYVIYMYNPLVDEKLDTCKWDLFMILSFIVNTLICVIYMPSLVYKEFDTFKWTTQIQQVSFASVQFLMNK